MTLETSIHEETRTVSLKENGVAEIGDHRIKYELTKLDNSRYLLRSGTRLFQLRDVHVQDNELQFSFNGKLMKAVIRDEQMLLLDRLGFKVNAKSGEGKLSAPMPGKIVSVQVEEGQEVNLGDPVIILEAMKMENELKAPAAGKVAKIHVNDGDSVEKNHVLLEIEPIG